jgi:hypothetical protein
VPDAGGHFGSIVDGVFSAREIAQLDPVRGQPCQSRELQPRVVDASGCSNQPLRDRDAVGRRREVC